MSKSSGTNDVISSPAETRGWSVTNRVPIPTLVELGIVIGRRASYPERLEEARGAIAGYMLLDAVSERSLQLERGGQWTKGKSAETFDPAGPWLTAPDALGDLQSPDTSLDVHGERRQPGSTATTIFARGSSCST